MTIFLQLLSLVALFVVVRDYAPDPVEDSLAWKEMGPVVEFVSITSVGILFTLVACAAFCALDPEIGTADRARLCRILLACFGLAVALTDGELAYFGLNEGLWEFFGGMAAVTSLDFAIVFLVMRYLDLGGRPRRE